MIEYRLAKETDYAAVRALWEAAFGNEQPYTDWYFRSVYQPEQTVCAELDSHIVACLQVANYTVQLGGRALDAAYLVGVTTDIAFRHQGIGHALLRWALASPLLNKKQLVLLSTEIPAYYEPVGFETRYYLRRLHFPPGGTRTVDWASLLPEEAVSRCLPTYHAMCRTFDGYVVRSTADWLKFLEDHVTDANCGILVQERAYLLWGIEKAELVLRELGYADATALAAAIAAACALAKEKGCETVRWDAPESVPLSRQEGETRVPFVMAWGMPALESVPLWIGEIT